MVNETTYQEGEIVCHWHDYDAESRRLIFCREPATWVHYGRNGDIYFCDTHMEQRGNEDGRFERLTDDQTGS